MPSTVDRLIEKLGKECTDPPGPLVVWLLIERSVSPNDAYDYDSALGEDFIGVRLSDSEVEEVAHRVIAGVKCGDLPAAALNSVISAPPEYTFPGVVELVRECSDMVSDPWLAQDVMSIFNEALTKAMDDGSWAERIKASGETEAVKKFIERASESNSDELSERAEFALLIWDEALSA